MRKNYFFITCLLLGFSTNGFSQNDKYDEELAHQKTLVLNAPSSREYAIAQFGTLFKLDKNYSYETIRTTSDVTGMTHERIQQFYKGLKVEFGVFITHARDGKILSVNGELYNASTADLSPRITKEAGFLKAVSAANATTYLWDDPQQAALMNYSKPSGEMLLFPIVKTGEVKLVYKYDIYAVQPILREEIYVDAVSGDIVFRNPIIKHAHGLISSNQIEEYSKHVEAITVGSKSMLVAASADTKYSGNRSIETTFNTGLNKYVLEDTTRGNGVVTYNSARTNTMPSTHFEDADNNWTAAEYNNTNKDNAALDAHWGAMKTYDFWKNTFNRNSFDDNNGQIRSYVHFDDVPGGSGWFNAQWTGSVMRYGDGNGNPLTSVDIIGHEIGHGVCQYTANLAYQNQSGAMNEGFSDIWGACIEQYAKFGNLNAGQDTASPGSLGIWKIGEELSISPLRSMSYPNSRSNPDTFKGTYYTTTADDGSCTPGSGNDNCGVHNNSGVFNHWFYILTAGKAGMNNAPIAQRDTYNVTGIGMAKSSQIAYYTERDYLTPNATFTDARNASLTVANSLYCASSPEVIAVTDAWMAVNIGNAYAAQTNDVTLKTISSTSSISCGVPYSASIVFENAGSNTISSVDISYNVDGGANTNATWTGNLPNCSMVNYPITLSGLTRGTHTLSVTTTVSGDGVATNNTKTALITVNDNGTINVVNTFNATSDALVSIDQSGTTNTVWQRGTSMKTLLSNTVAGSQVYATKTFGNYPDNTTSYLVSQCYDLTTVSNPTVSFDMAFDLEANWDIIYFEYSTNGGNSWSVLGTASDPNWYNSSRTPNGTDCFNCIGKQWTGDYATAPSGGNGMNGNKRNYSHSLSQFGLGGGTPASNIMFRFTFVSDEAVTQEGAIIDNFVVQGTLSTKDNGFETFNVWPNPSNGNVTIQLNTSEKVNVSLFDMRGRNVYNKVFNPTGTMFNQEVSFNALEKGVYLLSVESEGKKATRKLIIN
ncbi:M4 family metallopeptidase [Flavobacterium enshiense]|uniref:M4 family metallopeptidase n=1 Tax=Flavobacterium enshiense TaxID=1341165 RepID=UPI00345DBA92